MPFDMSVYLETSNKTTCFNAGKISEEKSQAYKRAAGRFDLIFMSTLAGLSSTAFKLMAPSLKKHSSLTHGVPLFSFHIQTLLESDDLAAYDFIKLVTINLFLLHHITSLDNEDDYDSLGKDDHHVRLLFCFL